MSKILSLGRTVRDLHNRNILLFFRRCCSHTVDNFQSGLRVIEFEYDVKDARSCVVFSDSKLGSRLCLSP